MISIYHIIYLYILLIKEVRVFALYAFAILKLMLIACFVIYYNINISEMRDAAECLMYAMVAINAAFDFFIMGPLAIYDLKKRGLFRGGKT